MIKYTLTCPEQHVFDSWFSSSADFDRLAAAGHLSCAICGHADIEKALMAPRVAAKESDDKPLSKPASPAEQALRALKDKVEREAEDVGTNFATEARAIHDGEAPARSIYGEARLDEAKKLIEDGVQVAPLPFRPTRKTN